MIVLILCIILLLIAIDKYNKGNKVIGTFIFFFFITNWFLLGQSSWLEGMPLNKYTDFALLYMFYVILKNGGFKRSVFSSITCYKCFGVLTAYLTIEFLITILSGTEDFGFSLKIFRNYLFFLSFFIFEDLDSFQIKKIIQLICWATIVTAVIYVTQPLHALPILSGSISEGAEVSENGMIRYRNIPELLYFILCFAIISLKFSNIKSVLLVGLCAFAVVLTQHRAVMMAFVVIVALYLYLSKQNEKIIQYGIVGIIGFALVGNLIKGRFENSEHTSTMDDISTVLNLDYRSAAADGYDDNGGTLAFRILLFVERFDYFIANPKYMLTGVGMMHEDSPNTQRRFNFVLGSRKLDKSSGMWIPQQISSADMVWFIPFMKFGLIGLLLYIITTIYMFRFFLRHKDSGIVTMSAFLYYVLLIFISFKNDMLFAPIQLSFLFLMMSLIRKVEQSDDDMDYFLNFNITSRQ